MKKLIVFLLIVGQLVAMFGSGAAHAYAANLYQGPLVDSGSESIFTFKELGYSERLMVGPYDSIRMLFSLPPTWQLDAGGKISLRFNFIGGAISTGGAGQGSLVGGLLTVFFNNVIVDTVVLEQNGPVTREIFIPLGALNPISGGGRNAITLVFDASANCDNLAVQSNLIVSSNSEVDLKYKSVPPSIDLANFPNPIYQPQALMPTATTVVLPDKPTIGEIQSALAVMAGLGSIANGELKVSLESANQLTIDSRNNTNLIFVGLASKFPVLQNIALPIPVVNGKFSLSGMDQGDGLVQIALSPWNQANVLLLVSGNTDEAIIKAGKALGSGRIVTSGRSDISVISSVAPATPEGVVSEDFKFSDLGYDNQVLGGSNGQYLSYAFYASAEQTFSSDAYLDLITSHSQLLDFNRSSITVILNNKVIGSLQFSDKSEQVETTRIKILSGILRRGNNKLEIISDLVPNNSCTAPNSSNISLTIGQSSLLHLPVTVQQAGTAKNIYLNNFPSMFVTNKNLSDLAFVIPSNDPVSWDYAAQIAYYIGSKGGISIADFKVFFGDNVPDEMRVGRNWIIIGRASTVAFISQLNDSLPAPFKPGNDEAIQPAMLVNYRLLPNVSVGYLQLLPSPWSSDRAILAVMGNTEQGIPMAGKVLVKDNLVNQLSGNFSILYGDQILSTDTRFGPSNAGVVSQLPVVVTSIPSIESTPIVAPNAEIQGRAGWLLPALIVSMIVILLIAVLLIRNSVSSEASKLKKETKENSDK